MLISRISDIDFCTPTEAGISITNKIKPSILIAQKEKFIQDQFKQTLNIIIQQLLSEINTLRQQNKKIIEQLNLLKLQYKQLMFKYIKKKLTPYNVIPNVNNVIPNVKRRGLIIKCSVVELEEIDSSQYDMVQNLENIDIEKFKEHTNNKYVLDIIHYLKTN